MSRGMAVSPQSYWVCSPPRTQSTTHGPRCSVNPRDHSSLFSSNLRLVSSGLQEFPRFNLRCKCNSTGDSGENESKTILDAFFLGKAVAEALNERVESAVGEFLSTVGRLQAEQQKQVEEFQEEVFERAKRAKEEAAREAIEAQGLITNSSTVEVPSVNGVSSASNSVSSTANEDPPSED